MSKFRIILDGIVKNNPTFVLILGMCPTLATTTSAVNGLSMGLATMFVLILANMVISLIAPIVPDKVHIPVYIVVIATFVTLLQLLLKAYLPSVNEALGLFIPLIVVNCIILGRAEGFANTETVWACSWKAIPDMPTFRHRHRPRPSSCTARTRFLPARMPMHIIRSTTPTATRPTPLSTSPVSRAAEARRQCRWPVSRSRFRRLWR